MFGSSDSLEGNWLSRTQVCKQPQAGCATERSKLRTSLVVFLSLLDVIIVFVVASVEYLFRWTDLFPIRKRQVNIMCFNVTDSGSLVDSELEDFWFQAKVPEIAVYVYSFSFPVLVVLTGEVMVFILANQSTKLLPGGTCSPIHIPHTVRRLYRFSLSFLFGILCLMLLVDSIKITVGELRPYFYNFCHISYCKNQSVTTILYYDGICLETEILQMRKARTSCPSMRSAISSYAAIFTTTYLHGIGSIHHAKYLLGPLISMTMTLASILLGISLVVRGEAWWPDIFIGHILGLSVALYMTLGVLRRFKFQETVSNRRILRQIAVTKSVDRMRETKEAPKVMESCLEPVRLRRAHVNCTSSYQCHCVLVPPLTSALSSCTSNKDDTSTFFPIPKPNRKSVTLPISSPHVPALMTHHLHNNNNQQQQQQQQQQCSGIQNNHHQTCSLEKRLSAVNVSSSSRRHVILSQSVPKVSQELINLLHGNPGPPEDQTMKEQPETSVL